MFAEDYFLLLLRKSWFTEKHIFKIIIYIFLIHQNGPQILYLRYNSWTIKIGEGSGPWQWNLGSTTGNRGLLPKSKCCSLAGKIDLIFRGSLSVLNLNHTYYKLKVEIQVVHPDLWQWPPGSTTFSNIDGPGVMMVSQVKRFISYEGRKVSHSALADLPI